MRRLRKCALLLILALLLPIARVEAVTIAYDRNYEGAYGNILQRACTDDAKVLGYTRRRLELFQDRRVDAVELYDFEAERYQRGASEPLYWYPHYTATIVLAVHEDASFAIDGWTALQQNGTIVLPDALPEREVFFLALAQRLADGRDAGFAYLGRMKESGRLRFSPVRGGAHHILWGEDRDDVYVLFAHETNQLIRRGARLRSVIPADGTLSFTKGILSRRPLAFSDTLPSALSVAGYPPVAEAAPAHAISPDFLRSLRMANSRYHRELLECPILAPAEPHERFVLLTLMLPITVIWGACIRRRVLQRGAPFFSSSPCSSSGSSTAWRKSSHSRMTQHSNACSGISSMCFARGCRSRSSGSHGHQMRMCLTARCRHG